MTDFDLTSSVVLWAYSGRHNYVAPRSWTAWLLFPSWRPLVGREWSPPGWAGNGSLVGRVNRPPDDTPRAGKPVTKCRVDIGMKLLVTSGTVTGYCAPS